MVTSWRGPRPVRAVARCLAAVVVVPVVLALGVAGCARGGGTEEASPSPTFLEEQTVCEVTSTGALRETLSFWTTGYEYSHSSDPERLDQNGYQCRIRGWEPDREDDSKINMLYLPGGRLSANSSKIRPFTDLDDEGHDPLVLDGVEGRGYIWLNSDNDVISVAWLYPDNHVLELDYFIEGRPERGYDDSTLEGMRTLMATVIPAIPEVAAGPDQLSIKVPADQ